MSQQTNSNTNLKELSFIALFSLIFGSMMGSGVFDVPQNVSSGADVVAISIGWIITTIGVFALSWAFVHICKKRPDIKSGLYGYAKHGFGDYVGFNAAWGYALNSLLANASYLIYICATLGNFTIFKFFGTGNTVHALIFESLLIWAVYFLVRLGIREAVTVNTIITIVKIIILIGIIFILIFAFNWAKFKTNMHFEPRLGSLFAQTKSTMLVTVWNFTGIEAACIFALRAKKMQDVIKATMLGAFCVCLMCALISILPFGILDGHTIRTLSTPSTAGILAAIYGIRSADFVRIAVVISVLGALLAWTMLASNMFYLAATDKTMPKLFTKTNAHGVPINALFISSIVAQAFICMAFFTNEVYLGMIQLATSLILLPYLLATLFAMKLVLTEGKFDTLAALKGLLAVLYGVWLVYSGGLKYLALSSMLYLVGAIFYFIARKQEKMALFANRWEMLLFILFIAITLGTLIVCPHILSHLNP